MLRRLEIENYGLIARAEIEFARGATIFTGETGSGKTMVLGALTFVLGARAEADAVRRGAPKATVTLTFDPSGALRQRLTADGFELDAGEEASISREMSDGGRSGVRINGRASTAAYVRSIADAIAEIVGQHEAQRLLAPAYHRELLDDFAGAALSNVRDAVARAHARSLELLRALAELQGDERRARERYDDAAFALEEIDGARPELGEDVALNDRRRYLDNAARIGDALRRAHEALAGDDAGAGSALGAAGAALASIAEIGAPFRTMADGAAALQSEVNELAAGVARALDGGELDPNELEAVNARLDFLDRLKRKYGGSLEAVLAHAAAARVVVDEYEGRDRRAIDLGAQVADARRELEAAANALSAGRKKAATALGKRMLAEFPDLALGSGRFEVAFEPLETIGADGAERVEFLFGGNAGEPPRALARVASGGELSRVLLALVVALSGARGAGGALVFDEIDAGIGGTTGTAVGARIGRLAREGQVVCVTHLAQLATWADRHYVLEKSERKDEATISVREISGAGAREGELARMLSGETHDVALEHARSLLRRRRA
ncbi:MAG TPA: DNA repair protein RecN [Candidatus Tumulicola sp.]|jgi:DNA repair protein RecN (Recombination protein N)